MSELQVGFLVFPDVTQLDFTGPAQVLSRLPDARVHYIWKTLDPVPTDAGFKVLPTVDFAGSPALDVICIPGGLGMRVLMEDEEVLAFVKRMGEGARYVTSVCTGSLVLAAAGLLDGYRATSHWAYRAQLAAFGATPTEARVVRDRNRVTGGGVTSGIDFALVLAAEIAGADMAKEIQLAIEYDPQPPFDAGTPEAAGPAIVERLRARYAGRS